MPEKLPVRVQPPRNCKYIHQHHHDDQKKDDNKINKGTNKNNNKSTNNIIIQATKNNFENINDVLKFIKSNFNSEIYNSIVKVKRLYRKLTLSMQHKKYLLNCRTHDFVPKHIKNVVQKFKSFSIHSNSINRKFDKFTSSISFKILNFLIQDMHFHINYLQKTIKKTKQYLNTNLPKTILQKFYTFLNKINNLLKCNITNTHTKKFNNLKESNDKNNNITDNEKLIINNIQSKWLVNLSDKQIPQDVADILSLGEKFNFKIKPDKTDFFELLNHLQNSFYVNNDDNNNKIDINKLRRKTICSINTFLHNKQHISYNDKIIQEKLNKTEAFLKENPDLFITMADKGNTTVITPLSLYNSKVENELKNKESYISLDYNPFKKLKNSTKRFLKLWRLKGVFDCDISFEKIIINIDNTNIPRCYGLFKIHKNGNPIRIIVSFVDSPLYQFDKCLTNFLKKHIKKPNSSVKNSLEVVELIKNNIIPDDYKLISLDVVAMFPSIPHNLVLEALDRNWIHLDNKIPLNKREFLEGINFLLSSTYLQFNNKFYKQCKGLPMGFCSSPLFCELVIEHLEIISLNKLKSSIVLNNQDNFFSKNPKNCKSPVLFYKRYVDDCLLIVEKKSIKKTIDTFNSYHKDLQFTLEREEKNTKSINFLDLQIFREKNCLAYTNWYRKPTFSGRYLNYHSHHNTSQKIAIVYGIVDKCIKLSDKRFYSSNLKLAKQLLISNNYPKKFIEKYIKKRIYFLNNKNFNPKDPDKKLKFSGNNRLVLPYFKYLNPFIMKKIKNPNLCIINKTSNRLNKLIKRGKDKINKFNKRFVIYKIKCDQCEFAYVGQTSRKLYKRINEHHKDYQNKKANSVFYMHHLKCNHTFDFKKTKIIATEKNYKKRLFSEMLHIHDVENSLNRQFDTEKLQYFYKNTIDALNKIF